MGAHNSMFGYFSSVSDQLKLEFFNTDFVTDPIK